MLCKKWDKTVGIRILQNQKGIITFRGGADFYLCMITAEEQGIFISGIKL